MLTWSIDTSRVPRVDHFRNLMAVECGDETFRKSGWPFHKCMSPDEKPVIKIFFDGCQPREFIRLFSSYNSFKFDNGSPCK